MCCGRINNGRWGKKELSKLKSNNFTNLQFWSKIQNKHLKRFAVQRHGVLNAPTNGSPDSLSDSTVAVKATTVVSAEIYSVIQRSRQNLPKKDCIGFPELCIYSCFWKKFYEQKVNFSSDVDF